MISSQILQVDKSISDDKASADLIDEGASSLKSLSAKIDTERMKKPSFLMVLTGIGEYAYKRPEDGVLVVPVGCLKD